MSLPLVPTPVQEIFPKLMVDRKIRVLIKRDDMTHPVIMGNKWRKLKYNLEAAKENGVKTIISYGGAYSNHIASLAAACELTGFQSIGIIRGEELSPQSNPTLQEASSRGMELVFVPRKLYRIYTETMTVPKNVKVDHQALILPEGGTNKDAIKGCAEILNEIVENYDIVCCPHGTGGTAIGVLSSMHNSGELWVFSALKGESLQDEFHHLSNSEGVSSTNYRFFPENRFGGYGKFHLELIEFINDFYSEYGILLDPIYTGKMFFSVWELTKNEQIAVGSTLLLIHTGGLQGITGFNHRYSMALPKPEVL